METWRQRDGGLVVGIYAAVVAVVTLGVLGIFAALFSQPLLFPSLGPTVMVLAERPRSASAHPRNVLVGHAVGIGAGLAALAAFGLLGHPSALVEGMGAARVAAAAASVAVTTLALQLLRAPHAPAGATTLIVSLGLLSSARDLLAMAVAITFVTAVATGVNLATGARLHLRGSRDVRPGSAPGPGGRPSDRPTQPGRHRQPAA